MRQTRRVGSKCLLPNNHSIVDYLILTDASAGIVLFLTEIQRNLLGVQPVKGETYYLAPQEVQAYGKSFYSFVNWTTIDEIRDEYAIIDPNGKHALDAPDAATAEHKCKILNRSLMFEIGLKARAGCHGTLLEKTEAHQRAVAEYSGGRWTWR